MSGANGADPDCLFCAIAGGVIPADIVASTDDVVVFRDIAPEAPSHLLVVSRRHVPDAAALSETDGELLAAMVSAANAVAVSEKIADSGYRLVFNVGNDAGNSVPHLHLHLLGGRELAWPPG